MGNNVNLCCMLGVPDEIECPKCHQMVSTDFDDYDIECGHPNPEPGVWSLSLYCPKCEYEGRIQYRIELSSRLPGDPSAAEEAEP